MGYAFQVVIKRDIMKVNTIRKLSNTIGFIGPAVCLYCVTIAKCHATLSVVLFVLSMGFNGFIYSGYHVTHGNKSFLRSRIS